MRLDDAAGLPEGTLAGGVADVYLTTPGPHGAARLLLADVAVVATSAPMSARGHAAGAGAPRLAADRRRGRRQPAARRPHRGAGVSGAEVRCLVVGGDADVELMRAVDRAPGVGGGRIDRRHAGDRRAAPACDALLLADADRGVLRDLVAASDVPVVVALSRLDLASMRMAMSAGARGVVDRPFDPAALAAALREAAGGSGARAERPPTGRVVAVCGAKGGVGATALAVGAGRRARCAAAGRRRRRRWGWPSISAAAPNARWPTCCASARASRPGAAVGGRRASDRNAPAGRACRSRSAQPAPARHDRGPGASLPGRRRPHGGRPRPARTAGGARARTLRRRGAGGGDPGCAGVRERRECWSNGCCGPACGTSRCCWS